MPLTFDQWYKAHVELQVEGIRSGHDLFEMAARYQFLLDGLLLYIKENYSVEDEKAEAS